MAGVLAVTALLHGPARFLSPVLPSQVTHITPETNSSDLAVKTYDAKIGTHQTNNPGTVGSGKTV